MCWLAHVVFEPARGLSRLRFCLSFVLHLTGSILHFLHIQSTNRHNHFTATKHPRQTWGTDVLYTWAIEGFRCVGHVVKYFFITEAYV